MCSFLTFQVRMNGSLYEPDIRNFFKGQEEVFSDRNKNKISMKIYENIKILKETSKDDEIGGCNENIIFLCGQFLSPPVRPSVRPSVSPKCEDAENERNGTGSIHEGIKKAETETRPRPRPGPRPRP